MAETTQQNGRIDRELWQRVQAKCARIRRPDISASRIWIAALDRFNTESDAETLARWASKEHVEYDGRDSHSQSRNARIDAQTWRLAQEKIDRLCVRGLAPGINATYLWAEGLAEFLAETDEESVARLASTEATT
jgi:hypothetical protein